MNTSGVGCEYVGDSVRNMRSDQGVDIVSGCSCDSNRHGIGGPVVDEAVGFEGAHGEHHRFDVRWNQLLKFLPVEVVHGPGGGLLSLSMGGRGKRAQQEQGKLSIDDPH